MKTSVDAYFDFWFIFMILKFEGASAILENVLQYYLSKVMPNSINIPSMIATIISCSVNLVPRSFIQLWFDHFHCCFKNVARI